MLLYRPVGLKELELIAQADFRAFPPRLPEQPIFYPVLNFEYAQQIARDWNTKSNSFAGFVTKFEVADDYVKQFNVQIVGSQIHQELWIPAEELEEFNCHIIGTITIEAAYYGENFIGEIDPETNLPKSILTDSDRTFEWTETAIAHLLTPECPWYLHPKRHHSRCHEQGHSQPQ
jgi:hypothetical protein